MFKSSYAIAAVALLSLSASPAGAEQEALGREGAFSLRTSIPGFTHENLRPATGDSTSKSVVGPNLAVAVVAVDYWITKDITVGGAIQ